MFWLFGYNVAYGIPEGGFKEVYTLEVMQVH
jgi:hypothetical protein